MRTIVTIIAAFAAVLTLGAQSDSAVVSYLEDAYNVRFARGNAVTLLPSGREKFQALESDLQHAERSIHMLYFNLRHDSISQVVLGILEERARAGVEVRVIIDAVGNGKSRKALRRSHIRALRKAGVQVEVFDRVRFPWFNHFFHRDHRKIAVIDDHTAYTGGMNIADYYIHGKGDVTTWRDMHLRIEGPAASELQRVFAHAWKDLTHEEISDQKYYWQSAEDSLAEAGGATIGVTNRTPSARSQGYKKTRRIARDTYCQAIDAAEHNIQIVNPYFVPSLMVRKALKRALRRGVDVEIMISAQSDVRLTPRAVEYTAHGLMRHGARVFVYEDGFHHSKTMVVDDRLAYVGSINLDHRSLYNDYECNVMIVDGDVNRQLRSIFAADRAHSFQLTPQTWRSRFSAGRRFRCWAAHFFRPIL